MRYCFDIDNTICETDGGKYKEAKPKNHIISKINELYDQGHYIILMTARGKSSGIDWTSFTDEQMKAWGVKHHELVMNVKPNADLFIDDKGINVKDWEKENINPTWGIIAGAFDLIHPGYVRLFNFCKQKCSHLTVALHVNPNSERSHKKVPILSIEERIEVLTSMKQVNDVVPYNTENDYIDILKTRKYDMRFLGSEYESTPEKITGRDIVPIVFHERNHDWSYTALCEKIKQRNS
jgi:cytidyltransferase-like protein